jgi:hypothetical protein
MAAAGQEVALEKAKGVVLCQLWELKDGLNRSHVSVHQFISLLYRKSV